MRIVAISDTHNQHDMVTLPPGDLLVVAGDISGRGRIRELTEFGVWLSKAAHNFKFGAVVVPGNHDFLCETQPGLAHDLINPNLDPSIVVLQQNEVVIDGLHFWGAADSPFFCNWAFNRMPWELRDIWAKIPLETDILITHCPPFGILDRTPRGEAVVCQSLRNAVFKIKPRVHFFGHIHLGHGSWDQNGIKFRNVAICDESYDPINPVTVVDI
jgi:Icc-related predicted phosphoesterase